MPNLDTTQLDEELKALDTEIDALLTQTRTLKEERDVLNQREIEAREERDELTERIDAIEQPRLHELKMRKGEVAKARMALRALNKGAGAAAMMLALFLFALLQTGCADTQHLLEQSQAKLDQAKAIAAKADAERAKLCAEALDALKMAQLAAPFACGLVEVTPAAPKDATMACANRDKLDAAVHNMVLACELGKRD